MFIYVIASGPNSVKIGYSADPSRRLRELQVGHEKKLILIHAEPVEAERAQLFEKLVHRANRHRRLHGEWFDLTHEQATREVQFVVIRYSD